MEPVQQPHSRQVLETRAPASAAFGAQRLIPRDPCQAVAAAQSAYYIGTGLWPLLHLRSFAAVTGPKPEGYLVKAVGACLANVGLTLGASLLRSGENRRAPVSRQTRNLGLRFALTFAAFDFFYAGFRRRISPVYLLNGIANLGFAGAWIGASSWKKRALEQPPMTAAYA